MFVDLAFLSSLIRPAKNWEELGPPKARGYISPVSILFAFNLLIVSREVGVTWYVSLESRPPSAKTKVDWNRKDKRYLLSPSLFQVRVSRLFGPIPTLFVRSIYKRPLHKFLMLSKKLIVLSTLQNKISISRLNELTRLLSIHFESRFKSTHCGCGY